MPVFAKRMFASRGMRMCMVGRMDRWIFRFTCGAGKYAQVPCAHSQGVPNVIPGTAVTHT